MTTLITTLVTNDNAGNSTLPAAYRMFATLRANGAIYNVTPRCYGIWFDVEGNRYAEPCAMVVIDGDAAVIRAAVKRFAEETEQLGILLVEHNGDARHIAGFGEGHDGASDLARRYGGATLLPSGTAVAFHWAGLMVGVDYETARS
jgi:hypothetical protein